MVTTISKLYHNLNFCSRFFFLEKVHLDHHSKEDSGSKGRAHEVILHDLLSRFDTFHSTHGDGCVNTKDEEEVVDETQAPFTENEETSAWHQNLGIPIPRHG